MEEISLDRTQPFLDWLYPGVAQIDARPPGENPTMFRCIGAFGEPGSGKTEALKSICKYGKEKYNGNISIIESDGSIAPLVRYVLDRRMKPAKVMIFVCNDMTLVPQDIEALQCLYRIRNIVQREYGRDHRAIILMWTAHRYYSVAKELRDISSAILMRSRPKNLWDISHLSRLFDDDQMRLISIIEREREKIGKENLNEISVLSWGHTKGIVRTPLTLRNDPVWVHVEEEVDEGLLARIRQALATRERLQ